MVSRRDVEAIAGSTLFGFAATASAKPEDYVSRRFKPAGSLPTTFHPAPHPTSCKRGRASPPAGRI